MDSRGDDYKRSGLSASIGIGVAIALIAGVVSVVLLWGRNERARAVVPLGSRERLVKIGDQWRYTFDADVDWMGSRMDHARGEYAEEIGPAVVDGREVMVRRETAHIKSSHALPAIKHSHYFSQDPSTGAVTTLGWFSLQDKVWRHANPPILTEPGAWSPDRAFTFVVKLENGDEERQSDRVIGTEMVSTPAGRFNAWLVAQEFEAVDSGMHFLGRATVWYVPQLGATAKADLTLRGPLGIVVHGNLRLDSTNVRAEETPVGTPALTGASSPTAPLQTVPSDRVK